MSLHGNDVCLLEVEDYNLYEEEASDHAFSRSQKHSAPGAKTMEAEKRIRREIANSNERRRMQSINAGFQALRTLLPRHEGEKLSKAAILQQTAEYIYSLEQEKTRLLSQNCQLKRLLNQHEGGEVPLKKRKNEILPHAPSVIPPDSTDDAITNSRSPEPVAVITVTSVSQKMESEGGELRVQLDRERRLRRLLEERLHSIEGQIYPDATHNIRFEQTDVSECKVEDEIVEEAPVETAPAPVALPPPARVAAAPPPPRAAAAPPPRAAAAPPPPRAAAAPPPPRAAAPPPPRAAPAAPPARAAPAALAPAPPAAAAAAAAGAPLLEAAIKAEPRVEVEVLPDAAHSPSRLYLASTSRQNLETIVEAIRHLEGDHLFQECGEAPLALTKKAPPAPPRPGVIVVKHS